MTVTPLGWRSVLDGRPWACTEAEQANLDGWLFALSLTARH